MHIHMHDDTLAGRVFILFCKLHVHDTRGSVSNRTHTRTQPEHNKREWHRVMCDAPLLLGDFQSPL